MQPTGQSPASGSSDGGSSPLIPILVAILVLAGLSLAVVMVRQRGQRSGRPRGQRSDPAGPASQKAS